MQAAARLAAARGKKIAIVPTMGALHEGHQSLIKRAVKEADVVITTIFVNPAQFAPHEDLAKYPRDEKNDLQKIEAALGRRKASGIVFMPKVADIYPEGFQTWVDVVELTDTLEGARRPGHFKGVTTVVSKLFNICRPDIAVFGMKDFQQAVVLKRMTHDLGYPIKYVIAPTVREADGLALSSRNVYLDAGARQRAVALARSLQVAVDLFRSGERDGAALAAAARAVLDAEPGLATDYAACIDPATFAPAARAGHACVVAVAARLGATRLIDNVVLGEGLEGDGRLAG